MSTPALSNSALIIGYGSPIRGDDAIGPMVADQLQQMPLPDWVRVEARHVLTAELAADLRLVDTVVFLDAAIDLAPGQIRQQRIEPDASTPATMAHFQNPRELLAWCRGLYGRAPQAWLITAGGDDFGYGHFQLSPAAQSAVQPIMSAIFALLGLPVTDSNAVSPN